MLNTIIIIVVIVLLIYIFIPRKKIISNGKFVDVVDKFNVLLNSQPSVTSLIITIKGKEDFIQFSRDSKKVEMDYPLVTERQKNNENKYKDICSQIGLELRETTGSDGSLFLDADVSSEPEVLAAITKKIFSSVFGATDDTKLKYSFIP